MPDTVKCPNCGTEVAWSVDNEHRPFCSKRCQLIDFGEWANEKRTIPSDADHDDVSASDLDRD